MLDRISFPAEMQAQGLEKLCTQALAASDFESAFRYADRRCRIRPLPKSHHYALRAEALARLGDTKGAVKDVVTALALSPDDMSANRRLLAWGDADQRVTAARALVRLEDDASVLGDAIDVLRRDGAAAVGAVRWLEGECSGWAVWQGGQLTVRLTGEQGETFFDVAPDASHPLSSREFNHAGAFRIAAPVLRGKQIVSLETPDGKFLSMRVPEGTPSRARGRRALPRDGDGITVIVPVYRNLEATRACLAGVEREIRGKLNRRVIVVDDATPEPKLARLVRLCRGKPGFRVLTNEVNLGFVGAVNRALAQVTSDDVVLLNSDTVVTPGFLDRMAAIAKANPEVGTITPLSNNGEFTSFPEPFTVNEMPSPARIREIAAVAARENADRVIDLPNGIGFCMFISRQCLDATGNLSHAYERGYLEDVDFCLRAGERGFRNVCAPSVYVAHHGSQSFGADKRALVMRNVAIVEQKFPKYRRACALFMSADPLRKAREAVERQLVSGRRYDRLLVSGPGLLMEVAGERAATLQKAGLSVLIAALNLDEECVVLKLRDAQAGVPQSLSFEFGRQRTEMQEYFSQLDVAAVEIVDPASVPPDLLAFFRTLDAPLKLLAADAGLLCRGALLPDGGLCAKLGGKAMCETCRIAEGSARAAQEGFTPDDIVLPCPEAAQFAGLLTGGFKSLPKLDHCPARSRVGKSHSRIGILAQGRTLDEFRLIERLLREVSSVDRPFVLVGESANDSSLFASGKIFVSGPVARAEYAAVLRRYGVERILLPLRRPLFGHPAATAARESELPKAYFDWTFGRVPARAGDLAIDPRYDLNSAVGMIAEWGMH